jgi:hypothetical protein
MTTIYQNEQGEVAEVDGSGRYAQCGTSGDLDHDVEFATKAGMKAWLKGKGMKVVGVENGEE